MSGRGRPLPPNAPARSTSAKEPPRDRIRFWAIVLAANLLGTLLFAFAASTGVFPPEVRASFLALGLEAA